jgi:hypothetical protein
MTVFKLTSKFFFSVSIVLVSFLALKPNLVLAASAYLTTSFDSVAVGDTVVVNVKIDPLDKKPNVVEGNIDIQSGAEKIKITHFSLAGSALTFWPQNPSLDTESLISFNGGVPGGVSGQGSALFKIVFLAEEEGELIFLPTNIKIYDNDGKASLIEVTSNPLKINIESKGDRPAKNQWLEIISTDKQAPQNLTVTVGQDDALFNGKKFLNIYATDDESGIDYYEVIEGDRPAIRSGENYVFQDQSLKSLVTVKVVDKAGNASVAKYEPQVVRPVAPAKTSSISYTALIRVFIILGLMAVGIILVIVKIKNKNVPKRKTKKEK